jgi:hypothetical protein
MKISMQNRFVRLVPIAVLVAVVVLLVSAPAYAVDPEFVAGNPTCPVGTIEFKLDFTPASGVYDDPNSNLVITIQRVDDAIGQVFNWSSNLGIDVVIVKGGPNANVYTYSPEASGDSLLHAPLNGDKYYGISHVSFCFDYEVDVTKSATPYFTRTFNWTIDKTVTPSVLALFNGESADVEWKILIDQTTSADSNFYVLYSVSVNNPSPSNTNVTLSDALFGSAIDNTCPVGQVALAAGATLNCSYRVNYPNAAAGTTVNNTVNADANAGGVGDDSASASATFTNPTTLVNDTVTLADLISLNGGATSDITASFTGNPVITGDTTLPFVQKLDCDDEGKTVNVATIYGDNNEVIDSDDAEVNLTCYELLVTKDAELDFTRDFDWEITKSVTPTHDLFDGESGDVEWTVTVTKTETTYGYVVSGSITINNAHPTRSAEINTLADIVALNIVANITDCAPTPVTPLIVPAAGSVTCHYSTAVSATDIFGATNTATAVQQLFNFNKDGVASEGGTQNYSGTANVVENAPTVVDATVDVVDPLAPNGGWLDVDKTSSLTFVTTLTCLVSTAAEHDTVTHSNTASIVDDGITEQASATATANCYELAVEKDATGHYDREYDWQITKAIADHHGHLADNVLMMSAGQGDYPTIDYSIVVSVAGYTDYNFYVEGSISISNSHPSRAAVINSLSDVVEVGKAGQILTPECQGSFTVPAGDEVTCNYATAKEATNVFGDTNTATAVQQLYNYDELEAVKGEAGTTEYSDDAPVAFTDIDNLVDECTTVTDTWYIDGIQFGTGETLGVVCATPLAVAANGGSFLAPKTFSTTIAFHPEWFECGEHEFKNVATQDENDTDDTSSDDVVVPVNIACAEGCSLTPGYWKTHSNLGPAPFDAAWYINPASLVGLPDPKVADIGVMPNILWDNVADGILGAPTVAIPGVNGPQTSFPAGAPARSYTYRQGNQNITINLTYITAMTTAPAGNVWFNLSNHFAAAHLNIQNGASYTAIQSDFIKAYELLRQFNPTQAAGWKANNATRAEFIRLAGVLGSYNEGLIGPGHCDSTSNS